MTDFNLDDMLASILDEAKPLPTITPEPLGPPLTQEYANLAEIVPAQAPDTTVEEVVGLPMTEQPVNPMPVEQVAEQTDAFPASMPEQEVKAFSDTGERDYAIAPPALPSFTTDEIAATLDIRNFATLVTLNTARWHAKVKDRKASRDAAAATGAKEEAFESRKRLLVGADEKLKAIHKAIDAARAKFYEMTLPWTTTGVQDIGRRTGARMLPNSLWFDFLTAMGSCKADMKAALGEFVPVYPALIELAKENLKGSFDISEYPNADSIAKHFDLSFDFQPVPVGSDFKGLPEEQCKALATAIEGKTKTMLENAMQDLWLRAHDAVGRMAERLSHPDKLFHHTLVENVRSVETQLRHLNVTGDARVEEIRKYIADHLCDADTDTLRKNPVARSTVAGHAQSVLDMMNRYGK